jgi:hypothetical protein
LRELLDEAAADGGEADEGDEEEDRAQERRSIQGHDGPRL